MARKADPYPRVLEKEFGESTGTSMVKVGLMDIPMDRIVGTWAEGRKAAFAGNFMPLLEPESEFAQKWMRLCEAHLEAGGIRDAISCYEYLGEFYVQEGHKRVSVLKHFGAVTIAATVTRVMPVHLDEEQEHVYHEFLQFFKASHTYVARLTRPGGYAHLQAAMGLKPDEIWDEETRRTFERDYRVFEEVYNEMNTEGLTITAGDALVAWLEVYSFAELREMTPEALRASLNALWGDLRLLSKGEHISVATEPEKKSPSLLGRILGMPKIKAAFIYENDPAVLLAAANTNKKAQVIIKLRRDQDLVSGEDADAQVLHHGKWAAKKWNTMVLPFDVTVAELSEKLGYAIVNVVNPEKTTGTNIAFRLEMNEIPANTPFIVKTEPPETNTPPPIAVYRR